MGHRDNLTSKEAWIEFYTNQFQLLIANGTDPVHAVSELHRISLAELDHKKEYLKKTRHKLFPVCAGILVSPFPGGGAANIGVQGLRFAKESLLHFGLIEASYNRRIVAGVVEEVFAAEVLQFILGEIPIVNMVLAAHGAKEIINKIVDKLYDRAIQEHQTMIAAMAA